MSFKWFTPPTNADNRDFGFREPLSEPRNEPRPFDRSDRVDILSGTPDIDTFEVETNYQGNVTFRGGIHQLEVPAQFDTSNELDILVYQEQERAIYLEGYQAPTARSYTYIEDFEPIEDEIIVGDNPGKIEYEIDNSFMPMFGPSCFRINGEWICI